MPRRRAAWSLAGWDAATATPPQRVATSRIRMDTERARDLDDVMARMSSGDDAYQYSVAWIDCLARGRALGRSVLTRGDHAEVAELPARQRRDPLDFRPRT